MALLLRLAGGLLLAVILLVSVSAMAGSLGTTTLESAAAKKRETNQVTNLQVQLVAQPHLSLTVEFTYQSVRYSFPDLRLIRPIVETDEVSTTFRTQDPRVRLAFTWASVTLLRNNRLSGMFFIENGEKSIRIDSRYADKTGRNLETSPELSSSEVVVSCGTVTTREAHDEDDEEPGDIDPSMSDSRPPIDPNGKGLDHHGRKQWSAGADRKSPSDPRDLSVMKWYDGTGSCFVSDDVPRRFYIGVVIDRGMEIRLRAEGFESPEKYVETLISSASPVYLAQMNVELIVRQVLKPSTASSPSEIALTKAVYVQSMCSTTYDDKTGEPIETDCCSDELTLDDRLGLMRSWASTLPIQSQTAGARVRQGHWHLLTDCHPSPGFVGRSYLGTLCHATHFVGVSSYGPVTDPALAHWRIFAHEVGHAFNSSHSFEYGIGATGGIMDYGDGRWNGDYQFHPFRKQEVCSEINSQVDSCSYFETSRSSCGDGIVDVAKGEECECPVKGATNCTDCAQCRFVKPSQCIRNSVCCDDSGKFVSSETTCTVNNRRGICVAGTCQVNVCTLTSTVCGVGECRVQCAPTSSPSSCSSSPMVLPDNVSCQANSGVCQSGTCVKRPISSSQPSDFVENETVSPTRSPADCIDLAMPWWDADGTQFTCKWYQSSPSMCNLYGFRLRNFGLTASQACCVCGGGIRLNRYPQTFAPIASDTQPSATPTLQPTKVTLDPTQTPSTPQPTPLVCPTAAALASCAGSRTRNRCATKTNRCAWCQRRAKPKRPAVNLCVPGPCSLARQCGMLS